MKTSGIIDRMILLALPVVLIWFIPLEAFSADRGWPRFYIEPSFAFLSRGVVEDAYTVNVPPAKLVPSATTDFQSARLLMKIGAELTPNIGLYGLIGGSNLHIADINFHSGLVAGYGGGARFRWHPEFYGREQGFLFLDYHFLTYQAKDEAVAFDPIDAKGNYVFVDALGKPVYAITREKITWREHVIQLGLSGRRDSLEPYGGLRLSFVNADHQLPDVPGGQLNLHIHEDEIFGLFAGAYLYLDPSESKALFIEGTIIDETSINLGFRVNF